MTNRSDDLCTATEETYQLIPLLLISLILISLLLISRELDIIQWHVYYMEHDRELSVCKAIWPCSLSLVPIKQTKIINLIRWIFLVRERMGRGAAMLINCGPEKADQIVLCVFRITSALHLKVLYISVWFACFWTDQRSFVEMCFFILLLNVITFIKYIETIDVLMYYLKY